MEHQGQASSQGSAQKHRCLSLPPFTFQWDIIMYIVPGWWHIRQTSVALTGERGSALMVIAGHRLAAW